MQNVRVDLGSASVRMVQLKERHDELEKRLAELERHLSLTRDEQLERSRLKKEKLRNHQVGKNIVDRGSKEDDAIFEKARVDVIGSFASIGLFDYDRNQHNCSIPFLGNFRRLQFCMQQPPRLSLNDRLTIDDVQRLVGQDPCT